MIINMASQRRRVSFADTVEDLENYDVCSDRRYVTSPRSKLHCKTILIIDLITVYVFSKSITTATASEAGQDE